MIRPDFLVGAAAVFGWLLHAAAVRIGDVLEARRELRRLAERRQGAVSPTAPPAEQDTPHPALPAPEDRPQ